MTDPQAQAPGAAPGALEQPPAKPAPAPIAKPKRGKDAAKHTSKPAPGARKAADPGAIPGVTDPPPEAVKATDKPKVRAKGSLSEERRKAMAQRVLGLHVLAANFAGIPILQIKEDEAAALVQSSADVCREFGLDLEDVIGGKWGAVLAMVGTLGVIYGPRYFLIRNAVAQARQQAQPSPGTGPGQQAPQGAQPVPGGADRHAYAPPAPDMPMTALAPHPFEAMAGMDTANGKATKH